MKRQKKALKRLQALPGKIPEEPISFSDMAEVYYDALDRVLTEMREMFASKDTYILASLEDVVLGKPTEIGFKVVYDFYNVDHDILMVESVMLFTPHLMTNNVR